MIKKNDRNAEYGRFVHLPDSVRQSGEAAFRCILDALYPQRCPVCERIVDSRWQQSSQVSPICNTCRRHLPYIREPVCRRCGKPIADERGEYCLDCSAHSHLFREGRCVFVYEGRIRDAVVRMKFQNRRSYIDCFAREMAVYMTPFLARIRPDVLVPVPMNRRKRAERGFDQCALLAQKLSVYTGIPAVTDAVTRTRYTRPQKGLGRSERRDNLRGAFEVQHPELLGGRILLVDDIYTTGSTLDEMARVILGCGNDQVWFAALCTGSDAEE